MLKISFDRKDGRSGRNVSLKSGLFCCVWCMSRCNLTLRSKAQMNFVRVTGNNVCTALSYAIYKYASQHNTALFAPAVDEVVSICLGSRSLINKLVGEIGTTITHWSSAEGTDGGDFSQGGAGSDGVESSDRESGSESRAQRPADDQLGDR